MIDTAYVYSAWVDGHRGGESETIIDEWLRHSGKRDRVLIATKVGMLPGEGGAKLVPARIAAAAETSLHRLDTDHIDLYYAHRDNDDTPQADYPAAFGRLIDAGKVRVLDASNFGAMRRKSALDLTTAEGFRASTRSSPNIIWSAATNMRASCKIYASSIISASRPITASLPAF